FCFFPFFFSSRRRHTRWPRDWSSDVCSSDLSGNPLHLLVDHDLSVRNGSTLNAFLGSHLSAGNLLIGNIANSGGGTVIVDGQQRSEERRVGKECRLGGSMDQ